jgi:hypothetical protein
VDANRVIDALIAEGSCLVEGKVGAGKTHLAGDITSLAVRAEIPSLKFSVHKNVGTKKGVKNALDSFEAFIGEFGEDSLIILDNVDMYGYSGSRAKRQYSLAERHSEVARYLIDLTSDSTAPLICATCHDEEWRKTHWLYPDKRKDPEEPVTKTAKQLLGSFSSQHAFEGILDEFTAKKMLKEEKKLCGTEADEIIAVLSHMSVGLAYRIVSNLEPEQYYQNGLSSEIRRIQAEAEIMTRGRGKLKAEAKATLI